MAPIKEDAMAKKPVSKKKAKEQDFMKKYNTIQGRAIPEKLTREFVDSLDIESMTEQEISNLASYATIQAIQGKHKEMLKRVSDYWGRNNNFGMGALMVELALSK